MYDDSLTMQDFDTWEIQTKVKCGDAIFDMLTPEMYSRITPYPGALGAVEYLRSQEHSIHFVTSCGPNNETAEAKEFWLYRHDFLKLDEAKYNGHFIPTQDKSSAPVHVLIDDHLKNVESFHGMGVLLNRRHNARLKTTFPRVNDLWEFVRMLEGSSTSDTWLRG